ncbi:MAG: hypothetical protein LBL20_06820 [Treponema sp.]|jgi:hypothetical protein|nr:hypothetical protein [Treponema sp.]
MKQFLCIFILLAGFTGNIPALNVPLDSGVFVKGNFFIDNNILLFKIKEPEIYIIINNDKIYYNIFQVSFDEYMEFGGTEEEINKLLNDYDADYFDIVLIGKFIIDKTDNPGRLKFKIMDMGILDTDYKLQGLDLGNTDPYDDIYAEGELFYDRKCSDFILKVFNYYVKVNIDDYFINTFAKAFEDNSGLEIIIKGIFKLQWRGTGYIPPYRNMGIYIIKEYSIE